MKVSEIFESIDGEGVRAGFPVTFIRLYGCNLNCSYCDSRYACTGGDYLEKSIDYIMNQVNLWGHKRVTLTGGEPLIHDDVKYLIRELLEQGYELNIETDGAVSLEVIHKVLLQMRDIYSHNLIITLDYKCPSSGMEKYMLTENFLHICERDVVKFVVGSEEDLQRAKEVIEEHKLTSKCQVYFSPVFGKIESKDIVKFMLENHLDDVRIQLQMHKFIWNPNMRGV